MWMRSRRAISTYSDWASNDSARQEVMIPSPSLSILASTLLAVVGTIALVGQYRRLRGTTLVAPSWWSLASLWLIAIVEVAAAGASVETLEWLPPARFAAAMTTFCPMMALLGAKRPQDGMWQLVVVTLLAILCLPSLEWLVYGGRDEIHPARLGFLVILIAIGTFNTLPTRYWPSCLLTCLGQLALMAPRAALGIGQYAAWLPLTGISLLVAAHVLLALQVPSPRAVRTPLDRVWLDFRDAYGVLWSLRVIGRMNASAMMYDWPVTLTWSGVRSKDGDGGNVDMPPAVEESLRTLLRRFVSPEWIHQRLDPTASTA
jgi:hypothetical protein